MHVDACNFCPDAGFGLKTRVCQRTHSAHLNYIASRIKPDGTGPLLHNRADHRYAVTALLWPRSLTPSRPCASAPKGNQVLFSIDYRCGHITITTDYDYRIAGRYMTGPEAKDTRQ